MMTSSDTASKCPYCGQTFPHPGICHLVKAIEYYQNGTIKRVELKGASDFAPNIQTAPWPNDPKPFWQTPIIAQVS